MIRKSAFDGAWYPRESADVNEYLDKNAKKISFIAAVCPHAGWIYSGKTAAKVYEAASVADTYILVGPNHTGYGTAVSVFAKGCWKMPMGDVKVDEECAGAILHASEFAVEDYEAHIKEHSLEVQIPFIQKINPQAAIVPITIMTDNFDMVLDLGRSIAHAIKVISSRKFLIIASSDMSHYEPKKIASQNDSYAVAKMLELDPAGLLEAVRRRGITMCGAAPSAAVIQAAKEVGATKARKLAYSTSADITHDDSSVVSYTSIVFY